jgi:hypothetical protein
MTYYEKNKDRMKQYYLDNKEKIKLYYHDYYHKNRDWILYSRSLNKIITNKKIKPNKNETKIKVVEKIEVKF